MNKVYEFIGIIFGVKSCFESRDAKRVLRNVAEAPLCKHCEEFTTYIDEIEGGWGAMQLYQCEWCKRITTLNLK